MGCTEPDAAVEQIWQFIGGNWMPVEPPLPEIAAHPEEHLGLLLRFDALGHSEQLEALPQPHHRGDNGAALTPHRHALDKAAVYLDFIKR